jgi:hypothetical protein
MKAIRDNEMTISSFVYNSASAIRYPPPNPLMGRDDRFGCLARQEMTSDRDHPAPIEAREMPRGGF